MKNEIRSFKMSYYNEEYTDTVVPYLAYHLMLTGTEDIKDFAFMCKSVVLKPNCTETRENVRMFLEFKVRVLNGMLKTKKSKMALQLEANCPMDVFEKFDQRRLDCGYWAFYLLLNEDYEACRLTINLDGTIRTQEIVWFPDVPYAFPSKTYNTRKEHGT